MAADSHREPSLREEENDPLWQLLARSPLPHPDGWFTARALARCRYGDLDTKKTVSLSMRLARIWRWLLGGGLAFTAGVALVVAQLHAEKVDKQKKVQEAFEIMASIEPESDSSSSSSSWQDSSL